MLCVGEGLCRVRLAACYSYRAVSHSVDINGSSTTTLRLPGMLARHVIAFCCLSLTCACETGRQHIHADNPAHISVRQDVVTGTCSCFLAYACHRNTHQTTDRRIMINRDFVSCRWLTSYSTLDSTLASAGWSSIVTVRLRRLT